MYAGATTPSLTAGVSRRPFGAGVSMSTGAARA